MERPNTKHANSWFSDNCSLWFATQIKFETHESCSQTKPKIVSPKLKQIKFKNHYKQQEVKNVIYSYIECYRDSINEKRLGIIHIKYLIMYLLPLVSVGEPTAKPLIMEITNHILVQNVSKIMSKTYWK